MSILRVRIGRHRRCVLAVTKTNPFGLISEYLPLDLIGRTIGQMSDEEYEYDYGSDAEEYNYGSDGSNGDEGSDDELIEIENSFYEADDIRGENPGRAMELYALVPFLLILLIRDCIIGLKRSSNWRPKEGMM